MNDEASREILESTGEAIEQIERLVEKLEEAHPKFIRYVDNIERAASDASKQIDRWIIGYGIGIIYLTIEGVGLVKEANDTCRIVAAIFGLLGVLLIGALRIWQLELAQPGAEVATSTESSLSKCTKSPLAPDS